MDEVELLAGNDRAVEVDDRIAAPDRAHQVCGVHPKAGLLGEFTSRRVSQLLPWLDLTTDGEPPPRRGAIGDRGVRSAEQQNRAVIVE